MVAGSNPARLTMIEAKDRRDEGLTKEGFPIEQEEIVPEFDPRLNPENWKFGQAGMVGDIIKPIDQTGVEKGKVRIIDLSTPL